MHGNNLFVNLKNLFFLCLRSVNSRWPSKSAPPSPPNTLHFIEKYTTNLLNVCSPEKVCCFNLIVNSFRVSKTIETASLV
jgi:hypothetical protein